MMTKKLAYLSLFLALQVFLSFFYVQVSDNLRIYFTYVIVISVAIIFEPKIALTYAVVEDLIAFFIYPTGPFFFGYTITAFMSMLIYSLFLNKKVSLLRIIFAKTSVNIICNILINSIWSAVLYSKGFIYYVLRSTTKNLIMLPIEIVLFVLFYKMVYPLFVKSKLISENDKNKKLDFQSKKAQPQ